MARLRRRRSISTPIILSSVAVALSIALLVGWTLAILKTGSTGLMVIGILSFVVIMTVLVLFAVFLAREIREVRRQETFIDSVTHELKSPLASLRLCAETLARPELPAERREQLRVMMLEDVKRLVGTVDGILQATRLVAGSQARDLRTVDLRTIVDEAAATVAARHHLEPETFSVEAPEVLEMAGDPVGLQLVFENLFDNAVKYSDESPEVHVAVRANDEARVDVDVRDHGIGIDSRDLKRIFQRFYRAPEEKVRERHGTGLGLYVVASLVRQMGGRIEAASEGPGEGTTFSVRLPRRLTA